MSGRIVRLGAGEFFGSIVDRRETAGLLLSESRHSAGQVIPPHEHAPAHFCIGVRGACVERIRGRDIDCVPGTAEFHPAGTRHSSRWGHAGGRCFTVTLGAPWERHLSQEQRAAPRAGILNAAAGDLMMRLRREFIAFDASSPLVIEGLTLALLGTSQRAMRAAPRGIPSWMSRVTECLWAVYTQPVRLEHLAAVAGVSVVQLARWFRRVHGCTVGEWVRARRVDHAARLLAETDASISEVALASGFADHSHLTRTFARWRQLTPRAYRATMRSGRSATGD